MTSDEPIRAAPPAARPAARPGSHHAALSGKGARPPLRQCPGAGRRPPAIPRGEARGGAAGRDGRPVGPHGPATAAGHARCSPLLADLARSAGSAASPGSGSRRTSSGIWRATPRKKQAALYQTLPGLPRRRQRGAAEPRRRRRGPPPRGRAGGPARLGMAAPAQPARRQYGRCFRSPADGGMLIAGPDRLRVGVWTRTVCESRISTAAAAGHGADRTGSTGLRQVAPRLAAGCASRRPNRGGPSKCSTTSGRYSTRIPANDCHARSLRSSSVRTARGWRGPGPTPSSRSTSST